MKNKKQKKERKDGYLTGGMTMLGVGVGFFLFQFSVFYFVGSILAGIGIGLLIEYSIGCKQK